MQFLLVSLEILDNKPIERTFRIHGTMRFRIGGSVEGYEDIGHYTTATIDDTSIACVAFERVGEVDAVGTLQFALLETIEDVFVVTLLITFGVWLLNATARWCIIM